MVNGNLEKLPRARFRYRQFYDTVKHVCQDGDTLWGVAAQYYGEDFPRAGLLYWIIGDFQPVPVVDPTVVMQAGNVLYVPSVRVVKLYLEDPAREPDYEAW